ncbi:MAG TPA: GAF domain-containing sensor histidine kinase, partial [Steroidobacteraceae bacterium]
MRVAADPNVPGDFGGAVDVNQAKSLSQHLLGILEQLLRIPTGDLKTTMIQSTDLIAATLQADKVDAFFYDSARDSLVALSSSNQPLSALQRKLGLDVLPLSNGGRVVGVYKTGITFATGNLQDDAEELRGVKEGLGIQSKIGVPLEIEGKRRGMVMIASCARDRFSEEDVRRAEMLVHWIGILAHRAELAEQMQRNAAEHSRRATADELIAVVAHDVRNYLAPIELRLRLLRNVVTREHRTEELLKEIDLISRPMGQLRTLVSDLLDVSRLDQGLFRMDPAPLELVVAVKESANALGRSGMGLDVRVQCLGSVVVLADPVRLRQCIDNLIVNAIQQSPRGGTVTIVIGTRTESDEEYALVQIIDEGPGVTPELLPHIFERHVTSTSREGGLGLGLFLAKRIAELHGGDISVESPPGRGAR